MGHVGVVRGGGEGMTAVAGRLYESAGFTEVDHSLSCALRVPAPRG